MKILVTGASGQVGAEIVNLNNFNSNINIIPLDRSELDITDLQRSTKLCKEYEPDCIINCAAYTAVDKSEDESYKKDAYRVNSKGVENLAIIAKELNTKLIHISTDYVYGDVTSKSPILETAETQPINVYGASKLEGEQRAQNIIGRDSKQLVIVRTSSVHGKYGNNFVHTMERLFKTRDEVKVIEDQIMSPTWAGWLGKILIKLSISNNAHGIINVCCKGETSWYEFAREILNYLKNIDGNKYKSQLTPVPSTEFKTPAKRASYSVMNTEKLSKILNEEPIDWKKGLTLHLSEVPLDT